MRERPWLLAETTWATVRERPYQVAVLPWGATEAHNLHLPYGTDVVETAAIAAEAGRLAWETGAGVVVLPTVPFGVQTGQLDIPLCLNMNPSTQLAVLGDLASGLAAHGIEKLVILNGHGGNDFRAIVRELQPGVEVFLSVVSWYTAENPARYFDEPGDHAGEMETSVMLHVAPELVRPVGEAGAGTARAFRPRGLRDGTAWAPRHWPSVTDDTGVGNPRAATAEKGRRYFEAVSRKIADYLIELDSTDLGDLYER